MSQYTYLIVAEDANCAPIVFSCPAGWKADPEDYIEFGGELFPVKKTIHVSTGSEEYKLIDALAGVREADAIYSRVWSKKDSSNG